MKNIKLPTLEETQKESAERVKSLIDWCSGNFFPMDKDVVINMPTDEEVRLQGRTKSGLYQSTKEIKNSYLHTVLAIGENVKNVRVGDKIYIKPGGNVNAFVKEDMVLGQIPEYQILAKGV